MIGRSKDSVLRWIRENRILDVKRDRYGHRVWTDSDIERFRALAQQLAKNNNQNSLFT